MIELFAININQQQSTEEINILKNYISHEKQARIKRFYHYDDLKRSLLAEILVRWQICKKLGISNREIAFETNQYGKPYLKDIKDYHFNVSHSGDWVIMAQHNTPIGVDVEQIKPMEMNIAKRFFSEREYNDLMDKAESQQLSYFFQLWSLKESFIKAIGKGLSMPLDSFSFSINNEGKKITLYPEEIYTNYYFKMYNIDPCYKMALCTNDENAIPDEVSFISINELYKQVISTLLPYECQIISNTK